MTILNSLPTPLLLPIHVLIVDDTEKNLTALEALLAPLDIILLKASSGADALELLLVHEVALALIDVQMPNMDGFELAELIRGSERTRTVPLIFLTAATHESSYSFRGYEAGAVDFLFKPLDAKALLSKVNIFVQLYQQSKMLSAQLAELRQSLHLNELFTAVLGHDLRTPLSVVMTGAALVSAMTDNPKIKQTSQRIETSGRRMARMVDQLLDLARIRFNGIELQQSMCSYVAICGDIIEEIQVAGETTRVSVESTGDVVGSVDGGRFEQVFSNLIGNALQHGAQDHPVEVFIDGRATGVIVISVRNGGVIDPEQLPFIFKPFHQGVDSRRTSQGLGLGLYTVIKFVEAHGGRIEVVSNAAQGTIFTLTMPRQLTAAPTSMLL